LASVAAFYYETDTEGLPTFNGYSDVLVKKSTSLKEYIMSLSERLDAIRNHVNSDKTDNLLKITTDGRKAALDLRLIDEVQYKGYIDNKITACALKVCNIYLQTKEFKGTQLVFCDTSVPNKSFNVYDELKNTLIKYGIPQDEVAFIHDATTDKKRNILFDAMNAGNIRILIGSTMKLGTGVNVQDRLYAIHHLDIPWRPSDMVQREGRIKRIGNKCNEIFIYRYITEGSFDAYSWQILENKQKFIGELLSNSLNERTKEDIQDAVLNYGEVKALAIGNPKLQEHVNLKNRISKLKILQKKYNIERSIYKRELIEIPAKIEELNDKISKIKSDVEFVNSNTFDYSKDDKQNIRSLIWNELMDNLGSENEIEILKYKGFSIKVPDHLFENNLFLIVERDNRYCVELGTSELGAIIRIDNLLDRLQQILDDNISKRDDLINRQESISEELKNEIDYSSEIIKLNEELELLNKELNINE
jgi:superfamily II DNA/RNA helicase